MNCELLKKLREERGETRRDVAMATGLTENAILLLENGTTTNPRLSTVKALSEHYGVTVEDLTDVGHKKGAPHRA